MDDFETFAREKISRLKAEAEALEKTLKEYQVAMGRAVRSSAPSGEGRSGGAFGAVLDALAGAGSAGLSLDDMIEAAKIAGFAMNRNTLRSQLFTAKGKGQVEPMEEVGPGHYRVPQPKRHADSDPMEALGFSPPPAQERPRPAPKQDFSMDDDIPF